VKYFISILLVSSFLFQNISKLIIVVNFQINREFIAKNLCVNRDKPKSCCAGKCELKKQLDEDDKKQNVPANTIKDKSEKQNYYSPAKYKLADTNIDFIPGFQFLAGKISDVSLSIFHPPPFVA